MSGAARLNGSAEVLRMSTRACWFRAGVEKSSVDGVKKAPAALLINNLKVMLALVTPVGTRKSWYRTWLPDPCASVIAAWEPSGGLGTVAPVSVEVVPL